MNNASVTQFQPEADPPLAEVLCHPDKSGWMARVLLNNENASVTQLVECQLPKLDVAGSNPVARSNLVT